MNFTLDQVPEHMRRLAQYANVELQEIQRFLFHQANRLILVSLAERLQVPTEKIPFCAGHIGNTSSASIPLAVTEQFYGGTLRRVVLCGFGVGLAIASAYVDLTDTEILRTVEL